MAKNGLKNKVFSGLAWSFGERILSQGVSFLISVILARLLLPEQYGIVTMVLVFINIANVFVTNGFGEALIQKKDATDDDFSTIFFFSMGTAVVLYIVLFFAAPFIADFYAAPELTSVLRVLAVQLLFAGINTIQRAHVQKHMQFRKFFFSSLWGTASSGIVGIILAYNGLGIWALVAQYLVNTIVNTFVLFATVTWKPKLVFSRTSAKELISNAVKLMGASLINTVYNELRSLIIGKQYSTSDLAFYNKGNYIPSLAITNVNSSISTVAFPAMATARDDKAKMKNYGKRAMKTSAFIIFPAMAGLMAVGNSLIGIMLTDKWLPCVPFLYWGCLYWACQPIQTTNWQIIKAVGRSDLCFKLEIVKKIIGVILIVVSLPFGVMALAASNALFAFISMLINIMPNKRLIDYSFKEQFMDLFPSFISAVIMGVLVYLLGLLPLHRLILLIVQVLAGVAIYVFLSWILKNDSLTYILDAIKPMLKKGKLHGNS